MLDVKHCLERAIVMLDVHNVELKSLIYEMAQKVSISVYTRPLLIWTFRHCVCLLC